MLVCRDWHALIADMISHKCAMMNIEIFDWEGEEDEVRTLPTTENIPAQLLHSTQRQSVQSCELGVQGT
jgi:hypothetical protein